VIRLVRPIERSAERDAAIEALLPHVPFDGWTLSALRRVAGPDADLLFPGGAAELVEAHSDLADRRMADAAAGLDEPRLSRRLRAVLALRLRQNRADKEAVRRGLAVLALPGHAGAGARALARTVDAAWLRRHAAVLAA
jgi:ubiquinone biosynthesis protein COQ9